MGNDEVCYHNKLQPVSNCEFNANNSLRGVFLCSLDGVNTLSRGRDHSFLVGNSSFLSLIGIIQRLV